MEQAVQVLGAVLILTAFAGLQLGYVGERARSYLLLNLIGSGVLAALALKEQQWGFVLLETVWAIVSAFSLLRGPPARTAGARQ